MSTDKDQYKFESIATSFAYNLQALRVFNESVGAVAAEHDRSALAAFMEAMKGFFPSLYDSQEEETSEQSDDDSDDGSDADSDADSEQARAITSPPEQAGAITSPPEEDKVDQAEIENFVKEPGNIAALVHAVNSFKKAAPMQERLLRTSVLVSLMSYFEALIADLIHSFYQRYPKAMPAEERMLSLAELKEIGSVEEAEAFLVAKEVDSILRESLESQLGYFSKRLKVDLSPLDECRAGVIEIDQRRNLFVHNRGIVNRTYLGRVDATLIEEYKAEKGKRIGIKKTYLRDAMNTVELVGTVLIQQCWRKWEKETIATADGFILNATFEGLLEERYEMVERLAQFAATLTFDSDYDKRAVCINQAIAFRDSGRSNEAENCLDKFDWSASKLNLQLALLAVRNQEEEFYSLLPRVVAAEEVEKRQLETWPLFRNFRGTERFQNALRELFKDQSES